MFYYGLDNFWRLGFGANTLTYASVKGFLITLLLSKFWYLYKNPKKNCTYHSIKVIFVAYSNK
jgi:hypothetical protein